MWETPFFERGSGTLQSASWSDSVCLALIGMILSASDAAPLREIQMEIIPLSFSDKFRCHGTIRMLKCSHV